jgi:hypothetical protein
MSSFRPTDATNLHAAAWHHHGRVTLFFAPKYSVQCVLTRGIRHLTRTRGAGASGGGGCVQREVGVLVVRYAMYMNRRR